ncbi:MAG: hypothetical protein JNN04_14050 [Cyclobacteriaceae bacterium]|nr:hypothetical protein [Cyclobacteriaceae bacterium]
MKSKYVLFLSSIILFDCNDQKPDATFDTTVPSPFAKDRSISILYDEGHNNIHHLDKTYSPFRDILQNDGYQFSINSSPITKSRLETNQILVIVNPMGGSINDKYKPAFDDAECNTIEKWVSEGGSLLLVTDHYPVGTATKSLAAKFGVFMGEGTVEDSDPNHYDQESGWKDQLLFTKKNGLLAEHEITAGVDKVMTFTGQSLSVPAGAEVLLKLGEQSVESRPDSIWDTGFWVFKSTNARFQDHVSTYGLCQGLALKHGQGKVVILGEAAMLTAQIHENQKFGMNYGITDNKQLLLNIMHWLTN